MKIKGILDEFIIAMREDKSDNTISYYITDLRQFDSFIKCKDIEGLKDWMNSNEEIEGVKHLKIQLIKIQQQDYLEEVLELTDYDRLVRMALREKDRRAIAIFECLLLTGVRVSELLQLKVQDITQDYVNIIGKGEKSRDILLPERLKETLKDYVKDRNQNISGYLFINKNNDNVMSRQSVDSLIKSYAGKAKVKLTKAHAHNFRHLSGLRMIEEGFTLDEVADILGHGNINTTRIYTRKTKKELLKAINRL